MMALDFTRAKTTMTFSHDEARVCLQFWNLALTPRHTKEVAYKTLVRSQLEYAAPIWHLYHETQIKQVEKVQRTAANVDLQEMEKHQ